MRANQPVISASASLQGRRRVQDQERSLKNQIQNSKTKAKAKIVYCQLIIVY
jgi:hypothetical protein